MTAFLNPRSLAEALEALASRGEDLRPVAGATDVVVWVRDGRMEVREYLNLSYLGGALRYIREEDGHLVLGGLTTVTDLLRSDAVRRHARALWEMGALFGSAQIRNRATVAGNLGTASPAGDTLPPLLALGAEVVLQRRGGERRVALDDFMTGPGRTVRRPDELITAVRIPKTEDGETSFYRRLDLRDALAISVAGVAVRVKRRKRGGGPAAFASARVALGAVTPTVCRAPEAEAALTAGPVKLDDLMGIGELAARSARPITDVRATAEYRRALIPALFYQGMYDILSEA